MEIIVPTFQDLYEDSTRKPALSPRLPGQATSTTELCLFSFHASLVVTGGAPQARAEPVPLGAQAQCSGAAGWDAGGAYPRADPSRPPDPLNQIETQGEVEPVRCPRNLLPQRGPNPPSCSLKSSPASSAPLRSFQRFPVRVPVGTRQGWRGTALSPVSCPGPRNHPVSPAVSYLPCLHKDSHTLLYPRHNCWMHAGYCQESLARYEAGTSQGAGTQEQDGLTQWSARPLEGLQSVV